MQRLPNTPEGETKPWAGPKIVVLERSARPVPLLTKAPALVRERWRSRRKPTVVTSRSLKKKLCSVALSVRTSVRRRAP